MMARMRKSRQNTMILILAAAIITTVIFAVGCADKTMELNGEAETVINIGEEYVEQGANIKDAEITGVHFRRSTVKLMLETTTGPCQG